MWFLFRCNFINPACGLFRGCSWLIIFHSRIPHFTLVELVCSWGSMEMNDWRRRSIDKWMILMIIPGRNVCMCA
jgi:hypothetical protein